MLTDWSAALKTLLEDPSVGLGIRILEGERDGISTESDIGCVFSPGFAEWGSDVQFANPLMTVRVWRRRSREPGQDSTSPPTPLYELGWQVAQILQTVQDTLLRAAGWDAYFRMTGCRFDHGDQGVEATLLAFVNNPAVLP
jgi:hypothetical protein